MMDYYEYSVPELVRLLGARFKDYRMRANLTQKEAAEQVGLTVATIYNFYRKRRIFFKFGANYQSACN